MSNADNPAFIIRAACGDAESLATLAQRDRLNIGMLLSALLALDSDPPPLALGAVLALSDKPPESLRARADAALQALCEPDAAPLIAALCARESTFRRAVAAFETLDQTRAAPIFAVLDILDPSSEAPPARLSDDAALRAVQTISRAMLAFDPWNGVRISSAIWAMIDNDNRTMIALRAAQHSSAAALLMMRLSNGGWTLTPAAARRALLNAVTRAPRDAVRAGSAMWDALDDDARAMLARSAAQRPDAAADLLDRIGADGWRIAPDEARQTLLEAVANDCWRAAQAGGAVWTALDDDQRAMLARRAAQRPDAAADLLDRIGLDGWSMTSDATRRDLLEAAAADPKSAARGGSKVWTALDDDRRAMLSRSAAQYAEAAALFINCLGPDGWRVTPDDARRDLLEAVMRTPQAASFAGGKVWSALDNEQRAMLACSAAQDAFAAANLIANIGANGWRIAPDDARRALLNAVVRSPSCAAQAGGALWDALDVDQRTTIARIAAQPPLPPQGGGKPPPTS